MKNEISVRALKKDFPPFPFVIHFAPVVCNLKHFLPISPPYSPSAASLNERRRLHKLCISERLPCPSFISEITLETSLLYRPSPGMSRDVVSSLFIELWH